MGPQNHFWNDMRAFKRFTLDIPSGSTIYGDQGDNNVSLQKCLQIPNRRVVMLQHSLYWLCTRGYKC